MNKATALLIVVILQTTLLVAMIMQRQSTLDNGTRVLLETRPVDPRSLFRGDYVRLNYTISTIDLTTVGGDDKFKRKQPLFVVLEPGERYWQPLSVHHQPPVLTDKQVMLSGEVTYFTPTLWDSDLQKSLKRPNVRVRYGIENYFVPEGEGRKLERPTEGKRIDIEVAIDRSGQAAISGLMVNDQRLYQEGIF